MCKPLDPRGVSAIMVALVLVVGLGLDIGIMVAASRMLWSFARDRGISGRRYISQIRLIFSEVVYRRRS